MDFIQNIELENGAGTFHSDLKIRNRRFTVTSPKNE